MRMPDDEEWRKKQICHTCRERDICPEGKKRYYKWGLIVVKCSIYKESI